MTRQESTVRVSFRVAWFDCSSWKDNNNIENGYTKIDTSNQLIKYSPLQQPSLEFRRIGHVNVMLALSSSSSRCGRTHRGTTTTASSNHITHLQTLGRIEGGGGGCSVRQNHIVQQHVLLLRMQRPIAAGVRRTGVVVQRERLIARRVDHKKLIVVRAARKIN